MPVDWTTYRSKQRGYAIDYPSDWTFSPARDAWPADGFSFPEDPSIDKWAPPTTGASWVLMFVSSVPLEKGETRAQRMARLDRDNLGVCALADRRSVKLDGISAVEQDGTCFGSDFIDEIVTVENRRFYLLYVLSGGELSDVTLATFDHFEKSFRFISS